ncbi:MAG: hypothetical protein RSB50_08090 [Cetobacterium sp.]
MNKVYKRFFDELDSHEIGYFVNIDTQFNKNLSIPITITLNDINNHDFFQYLESLRLIFNFELKQLQASFYLSSYFIPYYNYYLKNIKI